MIDLAYHDNNRLPVVHINLERLIRIRAEPGVSNPVGADVVWIEAPQISGGKDEAHPGARRVGIDVHALRRAGCVREGVGIVMVL